MPLDDTGMHRAGLAFVFRIVPVLVATILFGIYVALLCIATRGLIQRGFKSHATSSILGILYVLFFITSALWALEVAQLVGLVDLLLHPKDSSSDAQFNIFYAVIAHESKITGVLFETQMIIGDILVIWRALAIWSDRKLLILIPLFWWGLMIVNMVVHASHCQSGISTTNYAVVCKATDILAPVLSILTNISVMFLVLWRFSLLTDTLMQTVRQKNKSVVYTIFVLLIESGTLYVCMLITDLLVTSLVVGPNETVQRMIGCISGYATVQFVGIYPTLMMVVIRESVWNKSEEHAVGFFIDTAGQANGTIALDTMHFAGNTASNVVDIRQTSAGSQHQSVTGNWAQKKDMNIA